MAGGFFALLDDIAVLAKASAASVDDVAAAAGRASAKAAGVVVDDTAVTPRYVDGIDPKRELPIIAKITKGSLRNKLLIILPIILVLSQFLPWLLTPLLMIGGAYLSFEGVEKIFHHFFAHDEAHEEDGPKDEKQIVSAAVRTDLILSSEIMVIALDSVSHQPFVTRAITLVIVAFVITIGVYGFVGLLIKIDDIGLKMIEDGKGVKLGEALVKGMPKVLSALSVIGVVAMLWVGGHILLSGTDELGWHAPYTFVHHLEHGVHETTGAMGAVLGWLTNTAGSAIFGLIVGSIVLAVVLPIQRARERAHPPSDEKAA